MVLTNDRDSIRPPHVSRTVVNVTVPPVTSSAESNHPDGDGDGGRCPRERRNRTRTGQTVAAWRCWTDNLPQRYRDLLLIEPGETKSGATVGLTAQTHHPRHRLPDSEEYATGSLRYGSAPVQLCDGTPIIATSPARFGQILYYGYIESDSSFKYNYQYPVFWKRAVYDLAGRPPLPALNHETGETDRDSPRDG